MANCLVPRLSGYIMAFSYIGGGNRSTRRKQPTMANWPPWYNWNIV